MVPIRRNVVLEALGLINQGPASAKPRGSAPWVIDIPMGWMMFFRFSNIEIKGDLFSGQFPHFPRHFSLLAVRSVFSSGSSLK